MVISFSVIACNGIPDTTDGSSDGTMAGDGSVARKDSIKKRGSVENRENGNTLKTADTTKPGNSIAFPADSAKQKKP